MCLFLIVFTSKPKRTLWLFYSEWPKGKWGSLGSWSSSEGILHWVQVGIPEVIPDSDTQYFCFASKSQTSSYGPQLALLFLFRAPPSNGTFSSPFHWFLLPTSFSRCSLDLSFQYSARYHTSVHYPSLWSLACPWHSYLGWGGLPGLSRSKWWFTCLDHHGILCHFWPWDLELFAILLNTSFHRKQGLLAI